MQRRNLVSSLAASALAASALAAPARAESPPDGDDRLDAAVRRFLALPGRKSVLIHVGAGGSLRRIAHQSRRVLFTASAYKTFVLAQYLREVEAGRLALDEQVAIDDRVRNIGSPVFITLAGTTEARVVLEAMITHSDNTATDLATRKAGADRTRALIAEAGLTAIRIPDTTRRFASYILGAPRGVDLGWPGIVDAIRHPLGPYRPLLNDVITLAGNAHDFVSWYEQALRGAFFREAATLREFKRIQAMSEQIALAVPADTVAYCKGGEFPAQFDAYNVKSFAGQMIVGDDGRKTPVTFAFLVNWDGPGSAFPTFEAEFFAAIKGILTVLKTSLQ